MNEFGRCRILKEWPDWEYAVHADEAQIKRQGRSLTYPMSFTLNKKKKTARFSSSSDLPYYETSLSGCTCYDFQGRGLPCKHIYRLAVELGVIEIFKRTPGGMDKEKFKEIKDGKDIDAYPEQAKRQEKAKEAKMAPLSIDYETKTALFSGSGKKPYETTLESCTCKDYFVRRLPCKHIYRLRMELEAHNARS